MGACWRCARRRAVPVWVFLCSMPGGGTRKQQCGTEWLGSASCGQDPVKHGVIRRWIVMGELLGGLLDDPMLIVGIVPDDASKVDADVLARHVIENLARQIHIGWVRDEGQAIDDRGWAARPTHPRWGIWERLPVLGCWLQLRWLYPSRGR